MCNIAGYVGAHNATPILIEMLRHQEGLNGGFYSGLAVHDGENLAYRKVLGDVSNLVSTTDAETLSGTMGIAHSRTPSGGDASWAHPFVTERDGKVELCYVANGSAGRFSNLNAEQARLANELVKSGYDIPCKLYKTDRTYLCLDDGANVHMSDVMCQLIYKHKSTGKALPDAMTVAFTELPSEIVGLSVERTFPDRICFSRINKPMFVAFDADGAYLASSPTAFPGHITEYKLLPALSSGTVYCDRYEVEPYPCFHVKVRGFNRRTVDLAKRIAMTLSEAGECGVSDIARALKKKLPRNELLQAYTVTYIALDELLRSGVIVAMQTEDVREELVAPKTVFKRSI